MSIPKKIHYCWFGGNPKPKLAKKCIKSWQKYCSDYEIIEWNEQNFDISSAPIYVKQAYEAKKWAFVTDYVRLYAMTQFGGIYMDTDVEVLKPLDVFLQHKAFSGFENETQIPTGIMACEKDFSLFVEFLHYYDNAVFINPDGTLNTTTNVEIITNSCLKRGLQQNNKFQIVDGFALYPNDYFCPLTPCYLRSLNEVDTTNTATIHWFSGSWLSSEQLRAKRKTLQGKRKIELKKKLHLVRTVPNRLLRRIIGENAYIKFKGFFNR